MTRNVTLKELLALPTEVPDGFELHVRMELRTPLAWLRRHGERHPGPLRALPPIAPDWVATWEPRTKSLHELGIRCPELDEAVGEAELKAKTWAGPPPTILASGWNRSLPVYPDDWLGFLIPCREAIESGEPRRVIFTRLMRLVDTPAHARIVALFGYDLPMSWAVSDLAGDCDVGLETAEKLMGASMWETAEVAAASDAVLLSVQGIGPKTVERIRTATQGRFPR